MNELACGVECCRLVCMPLLGTLRIGFCHLREASLATFWLERGIECCNLICMLLASQIAECDGPLRMILQPISSARFPRLVGKDLLSCDSGLLVSLQFRVVVYFRNLEIDLAQ